MNKILYKMTYIESLYIRMHYDIIPPYIHIYCSCSYITYVPG